ncbi:cupin domain-containing protein [Nonomuraea cypriaca]|uniref:hypothetical protein n=1 Tax=Nonomuraea cypriaca TaxID=1187855 RepID=UPI001A9C6E35|nr:hypothetical protein [Nonomuraea cypriaca]
MSEADEVVLGPGGYITKPRGQMHAMWNAGTEPGRIIEVITSGGFENYFRDLSDLFTSAAPTLVWTSTRRLNSPNSPRDTA